MANFLPLFLSRAARHANAVCRHVRKLMNHQRDVLTPKGVEELSGAMDSVHAAVRSRADKAALDKQLDKLEEAVRKWIKPYPNAVWRENVEVLLVALSIAMAVRTFFLQPFKIPTGSMQPTLFGVTSSPDFAKINYMQDERKIRAEMDEQVKLRDNLTFPTGWARFKDWVHGISYIHIVAEEGGELRVEEPWRFLIFNIKQTVHIGNSTHTIWFPPDYGNATLDQRMGIQNGQIFRKGDEVVKIKTQAGDHLFVDRLTYNFRPPRRGEIVVFETKGIPEERRHGSDYPTIPDDQFYIKRLVGLGGETISLQRDHVVIRGVPVPLGHLVVDGQPITASTPHFENLYSYYGVHGTNALPYEENHYYGHAMIRELAQGQQVKLSPGHFFVMGDNTMNSLDSRYWGEFPASSVIGKGFFVYWPISDRFGWGQR